MTRYKRWDRGRLLFRTHPRILKVVGAGDFAPAPSTPVDLNPWSNRRVRRGSDPIHNRC
ncbi:hypothetical protein NMG60_11004268 [Bertholletia excelsa]